MSSAGGGFRQTEHIDALLPVRSPLSFSPGPFSPNSQPLFIRANPFHCEKCPSFQLLLFIFKSVTHTLNFTMSIQAITFETLAAVIFNSCHSSTRNVLGLDPESVHDEHSVPHSRGVDVAHQDNHSNLRIQLRRLRNGGISLSPPSAHPPYIKPDNSTKPNTALPIQKRPPGPGLSRMLSTLSPALSSSSSHSSTSTYPGGFTISGCPLPLRSELTKS